MTRKNWIKHFNCAAQVVDEGVYTDLYTINLYGLQIGELGKFIVESELNVARVFPKDSYRVERVKTEQLFRAEYDTLTEAKHHLKAQRLKAYIYISNIEDADGPQEREL